MTVHYKVRSEPTRHLFVVTMTAVATGPRVDLILPVWTPGSYMVREYSRHLQDFQSIHPWQKISKNCWRMEVTPDQPFTLEYAIYALELTVRTSHLDATHGYFNGACLFLMLESERNQPHLLEIERPYPDWQVATSLQRVDTDLYQAKTYDELVDSPVEIGTHQQLDFTVLDKPHHLVIWGQGNYDPTQIISDITRIIETTATLFGGLPYPEYWFILHCSDGYGGLEHHNCTSLIYPRSNFKPREKYEKFLQLVAHEFFHLWNVKRLRPKTLDQFDYSQENYVSVLWFCEGATAYFDEYLCMRCGFYGDGRYLALISDAITRLETAPGRMVQSLTQSSFDAWIKLYRPDENSHNSSISYYLKGQIVLFLLDLRLRLRAQTSLEVVLQKLWHHYPDAAYTELELWQLIETVAGENLSAFYQKYINGVEPLPYAEYLEPFGLQLVAESNAIPYTGIKLAEDKPTIKVIETNAPAQEGGLCPGDELVALDGLRVNSRTWNDTLKTYAPGTIVKVAYFRRDQLLTTTFTLGEPIPIKYTLVLDPNPTPSQRANYQAWLG